VFLFTAGLDGLSEEGVISRSDSLTDDSSFNAHVSQVYTQGQLPYVYMCCYHTNKYRTTECLYLGFWYEMNKSVILPYYCFAESVDTFVQ